MAFRIGGKSNKLPLIFLIINLVNLYTVTLAMINIASDISNNKFGQLAHRDTGNDNGSQSLSCGRCSEFSHRTSHDLYRRLSSCHLMVCATINIITSFSNPTCLFLAEPGGMDAKQYFFGIQLLYSKVD